MCNEMSTPIIICVSRGQSSIYYSRWTNLCKHCKYLEMRKISVLEKESTKANLCKPCNDLQETEESVLSFAPSGRRVSPCAPAHRTGPICLFPASDVPPGPPGSTCRLVSGLGVRPPVHWAGPVGSKRPVFEPTLPFDWTGVCSPKRSEWTGVPGGTSPPSSAGARAKQVDRYARGAS